ncbi:MAG: hypothetical protein RR664_06275 [Clostridia bacterium]
MSNVNYKLNDEEKAILEANINIVYDVVNKFTGKNENIDKVEALEAAMFAFIKAVKTHDASKSTLYNYSKRCIINEIYQIGRKKSRNIKECSLDSASILQDQNGNNMYLEDVMPSKMETDSNIINVENIEAMLNYMYNNISSKKINIYFLRAIGYKQQEIAEKVGFSRSYVARIINEVKRNLEEAVNNPQDISKFKIYFKVISQEHVLVVFKNSDIVESLIKTFHNVKYKKGNTEIVMQLTSEELIKLSKYI